MMNYALRLNDFEEEEISENFYELEFFYGNDKPLKLSRKGYFYKCSIITSIFMSKYYKELSDHDKEIIDMVLKFKPR